MLGFFVDHRVGYPERKLLLEVEDSNVKIEGKPYKARSLKLLLMDKIKKVVDRTRKVKDSA